MATATFVLTTPVAQPQQTRYIFGSPISIDIGGGVARVPFVQATAAAPIAGTDGTLVVALTVADFNSIMGVIIARAQALGQPIPAGSISVV